MGANPAINPGMNTENTGRKPEQEPKPGPEPNQQPFTAGDRTDPSDPSKGIDPSKGADQGPKNVLGGPLALCGQNPITGFYRTGCCETGPLDRGSHTVCAQVTAAFLEFTRSRGNDLSTPLPWADFPGLKPGDRWCLCASRWLEAVAAGAAPPVDLQATHEAALRIVPLEALKRHALSRSPEASSDGTQPNQAS